MPLWTIPLTLTVFTPHSAAHWARQDHKHSHRGGMRSCHFQPKCWHQSDPTKTWSLRSALRKEKHTQTERCDKCKRSPRLCPVIGSKCGWCSSVGASMESRAQKYSDWLSEVIWGWCWRHFNLPLQHRLYRRLWINQKRDISNLRNRFGSLYSSMPLKWSVQNFSHHKPEVKALNHSSINHSSFYLFRRCWPNKGNYDKVEPRI